MLTARGLLSFGLAAAVGSALCAGAEIPAPPAAEWPVFPTCQVTTTAEAQALFMPMPGSQPVTRVGEGDRAFFRLPGNFQGTTHERCSWDIRIPTDLSVARGIQFLFYSADSNPVSHYSAYCHSGNGWYSGSVSVTRDGAWERLILEKSRTTTEGEPAGWGAVDLLRISAWRARSDADTEFGIAHIGPVGSDASILVLRADSAAGGSEAKSAAQFAETVSRCLDELGLDSALLSDLDVTHERLAGRRLVILPHNPSVPEAALPLLQEFVAGGGRLMTFYGVPAPVLALVGLQRGEWLRPAAGAFQGMVRVGDGIQGQPAFVGQASWNITPALPEAPDARVLAVWRAADGKDTDQPAVTMSSRGVHVAHVLLQDDWAAKKRLMLALIGQMVPDVWPQAARRELARAGRFASFPGMAELGAALERDGIPAKAKDVWSRAQDAHRRAEAAVRKGAFEEALNLAQEAQKGARIAWCLTRPAEPGEHRAFWCHSAFGLAGSTWDESIELLARSGFNAILPNLLWGGVAFYPGEVLPAYADLAAKGDQLQLCLDACRKHRVQCHVWKVNWNMGGATDGEFVRKMTDAGRVQRDVAGKVEERWLCPSHPENQALEIAAMVDIARRYPVDGLHFDYIRYPGGNHCFCDGCRARFEQHLGRAVANWPADVRAEGEARTRWLDWRRGNITAVVQAVAEQARQVRPGVRISAAVFRNWPTDRDHVGQDWKLWCEKGYLDFVCPMDYTDSNQTFRSFVRNQLEWAAGKPCYPGIGLSCWADPTDPILLIEQIAICREYRTGGFTVFNFDSNAREVLPYLALGATAQ